MFGFGLRESGSKGKEGVSQLRTETGEVELAGYSSYMFSRTFRAFETKAGATLAQP